MTTSYDPRAGAPQPPPRPPRNRAVPWVVGAAVAIMVVGAVTGTVIGRTAGSGPVVATTPAAPAPRTAVAAPVPPAPRASVPDVQGMSGEAAVVALAAAGFTNIVFEQNGAPPTAPVVTQDPPAGTEQVLTALVRLVAEPPPPVPHREVSARDWLLVAKSPDLHLGERITVFGHITQFDTATGPASFRANVDGVRHGRTYEYETNTVLNGTPEQLRDVVQGDVFRADVTVGGTYSYQTTLGGTLTVPVLQIDAITVVG